MGTWNIVYNSHIEFKRIEAEFYQKKFIEAKDKSGNKSLSQYGVSVIHPAEVTRIYSEDGFLQIVLAQNVRDNVMDWTVRKHMDASMLKYISRNKLFEGDVLVTRSGANFGQTSVITIEPNYFNLYACADILILKPGIIGGPLLSTFLNTTTGKLLMIRGVYGAGQPHVAPTYISKITFPEFLLEHKIEIEEIIYRSRKLHLESLNLYSQATQILEQELGLDKISFDKPRSYTARFSEVVSNLRSDADYYQTKYVQLEKHSESIKTVSLSSLCSFQKGFEVGSSKYQNEGYLFIRVSNLTKDGFKTGNSDKYISSDTYSSSKMFKPEIGDILLTKDGTIGTCYVVDEDIEGIISSGIMKLKMKDSNIPKEYVALAINSKFCQMQAERECSGALISHWKPEQIRKLKIPIIDSLKMEEIAVLVEKAKAARKESKTLLEQAKIRVEELIEQSIEANA